MGMNNIIFFGDGNYSKGHCNFTAIMTIHLQMRTKTATRTSEWATTALDGLCVAYSSLTQSVQGSVDRCFQDLEKLRKAQTAVWTFWKARFIGYLRTRVTSAVSCFKRPAPLVRREARVTLR